MENLLIEYSKSSKKPNSPAKFYSGTCNLRYNFNPSYYNCFVTVVIIVVITFVITIIITIIINVIVTPSSCLRLSQGV